MIGCEGNKEVMERASIGFEAVRGQFQEFRGDSRLIVK